VGGYNSIPAQDYRVNEQIRIREILVIGADGEQLGLMPPVEALQKAREAGLDLVEVAPTASPPVCRLMDYGRFRYLATKKDRESRKNQKTNLLREIRFRPRTDTHDREAKLKRIRGFLAGGSKVKLTVMHRGREMAHPEIGTEILRSVVESLGGEAKVETAPSMEGRFMNIIVAPLVRREEQTPKTVGEPSSGQETKPEENQT